LLCCIADDMNFDFSHTDRLADRYGGKWMPNFRRTEVTSALLQ
jgi:hypothetical protein